MNRHLVWSGHSLKIDRTITDWYSTVDACDYRLHMFYKAMWITGIWMITSTYLMSSISTLFTVYLILHITWIFTEVLFFLTSLWICEKPIFKVFLGLSLTIQYFIVVCRIVKRASFNIWTEFRTDCTVVAASCFLLLILVWVVFSIFRIPLKCSIYCMLICGIQNCTKI